MEGRFLSVGNILKERKVSYVDREMAKVEQ